MKGVAALAYTEGMESDPGPLPDWQRKLLDERLAALEGQPRRGKRLGRSEEAHLAG